MMIKVTLRKYSALEITSGFITNEAIEVVSNGLMLKDLTDEELSEMWEVVHKYFRDIYAEYDETGRKFIGWKPHSNITEFARDTQSAWLEVINQEARSRRNK